MERCSVFLYFSGILGEWISGIPIHLCDNEASEGIDHVMRGQITGGGKVRMEERRND